MLRIQTVHSTSGPTPLKHCTRSLSCSVTAELQMVIATWTATHPTLTDGSMLRAKFTMSSITTKLLKALRISLLLKLQHKVWRTLSGAQTTFIMKLQKVTSQAGTGLFKLCQRKMLPTTDLTFSTLLRSGHILTTHSSQSARSLWTATLLTTTLRLSKLLSLHPIWCQASSQAMIRCLLAECWTTLILIATDLALTTSRSQSTALTKQLLATTTSVTAQCQSKVTATSSLWTTNQTALTVPLKTNHLPGQSKQYLVKLVDTLTSIQTQTTNNQLPFSTKFSLSKIERMWSQTSQDPWASADKISKIDLLPTSTKLTLASALRSPRTLAPSCNKQSSEIR